EHTVFEGEVTGAILALDIIKSIPRASKAHVFIDCQPAISAIQSPSAQPAQYLLRFFHDSLYRLHRLRKSLEIHIHWVPGHEDIEGSDAADDEAKKAAQGLSLSTPSTLREQQPIFPVSAAALGAKQKKKTRSEWAK
ncbi:hypothetical protein SCHPADRAFT_804613, partial [Schizopora paradoxa]